VSAPTPSPRKRRPHRRDQILAAAVELFHERGYHATGMDEIGAAAGITGPGIYRHFRNKEEILETLLKEQGARILEEVQAIVAESVAAAETLEALADLYATSLVENPSLAVVAVYERRTLSPDTRAAIERMERRNIQEWVKVLIDVRPELPEAEALVMVHAALGMGVAICNYKSGLDDASLAAVIRSMVLAALQRPPVAKRRRRLSRARRSA